MNGMMQQGPAGNDNPERIRAATFWRTAHDTVSDTSSFAGMDTNAAHLQSVGGTAPFGGVVAGVTDSIMVPALADHKIVVQEISVTQTGGTTGYVGTLAQDGEESDIIQFTAGQYGQARFGAIFELEVNKGLKLYRAQGEGAGPTSDVNIVSVYYDYVKV